MRVELSTYYRYYLAPHVAVSQIYQLGFKNQQLFGHKEVDLRKLMEAKEKLGLSFSMHPPFPNPYAPDVDWLTINPKRYREVIIRSLEIASLLGVDFLVIHGRKVKGEEDYNDLIQDIREICAHGKEIEVCIENHPTLFPVLPDEMLNLGRDVNKTNLKFAFDISHAMVALKDELKILRFFEEIKEDVLNLHLGNLNPIRDSHDIPDLSKPFFLQLFSKIRKSNVDCLTLEIRPECEPKEIKELLSSIKGLLGSSFYQKL
jgi:sugar phosphate isomerase/epimerase